MWQTTPLGAEQRVVELLNDYACVVLLALCVAITFDVLCVPRPKYSGADKTLFHYQRQNVTQQE